MSGLSDYARNAALAGGLTINPMPTNGPAQYADRQHQYFDAETRYFTQKKARYASDFVEALVQGLDPADPQGWGTWRIRMADVVRPSAAIQRHFDDYKIVLFESRKIEYIRPGTKINTMGSIWLVTNPINVSGSSGSAVVRRCNAVWNHLDYYGNVVSEPIIAENERANASASDAQNSMLISKGYFNIICQYNEETRQIDTNTRFILGTGAYRMTGYSDFEQEFTGDYSTVRLLSFTARYEEPNEVIDDMVNHVAGGKTFSWDVAIEGQSSLGVGITARFSASSVRNGAAVTPTAENPVSYLWESSDTSVATVDVSGLVTGIGKGTALITATLAQNPAYSMSTLLEVTETADGVFFTYSVPDSLGAFKSAELTAAYFEDGAQTGETVSWSFGGADESCYSVSVDGNAARVTCYGYSAEPLTVTASFGNYAASAEIVLEGI